jgi:hypothetical protein
VNLRMWAHDRRSSEQGHGGGTRTSDVSLVPQLAGQHLRARIAAGGPPEWGAVSVRRLMHPEDGSVTWFVGSPDIHVVDDASGLDALLNGLGMSRSALRFYPPELRSDFECDFGPC